MSDFKKKFPNVPSVDTLEDDAIIELVDEIEESFPADPISALEQQLLGISAAAAAGPGLATAGPFRPERHPLR